MATSLTFGNHLKFGQDSCRTSKGRPTFVPRVREKAPNTTHKPHHYQEGPPMGLARTRALPQWVVEWRLGNSPAVRGLGVDRPEGTWIKIKLILFDFLEIRTRPSSYSDHLANFSNFPASINRGLSQNSAHFFTLSDSSLSDSSLLLFSLLC